MLRSFAGTRRTASDTAAPPDGVIWVVAPREIDEQTPMIGLFNEIPAFWSGTDMLARSVVPACQVGASHMGGTQGGASFGVDKALSRRPPTCRAAGRGGGADDAAAGQLRRHMMHPHAHGLVEQPLLLLRLCAHDTDTACSGDLVHVPSRTDACRQHAVKYLCW